MIGLDTNVLVRYLTQDDGSQSDAATNLLEKTLTRDQPGYVCLVTLLETMWVLRSSFKLSHDRLIAVLDLLLGADTLVLQNEREVFLAVAALKAGQSSFADALIAALGQWAGCSSTYTFDKKAARLAEFQLL